MSKFTRRLSNALCLASNGSSLTLSSDSTSIGSSSKVDKKASSSIDGLPSYDEATLKSYGNDDMSVLSKKYQKKPEEPTITIEDVLNVAKPAPYMRWFKAAFSAEYQEIQAVKRELEVLRRFDVIIIVDDSSSMKSENRWTTACEALARLADAAMIYDEDGVDIYFLNNLTTNGENLKSSDAVRALFRKVQPTYGTPIGKRLKELTKMYMEKLWEAHENNETIKPRNYIIITDGVPTSKTEVVEAIQNMCTRLTELNCPQDQLGIQFIQVGTSRSAATFLRELDDDEGLKKFPRDIVDASPYTTEGLTANHILKVMKGAIDRRIDNKGSV